MTGRERTRTALSGGEGVAFGPLIWSGLPKFVHARSDDAFWLDVGTCQRMLSDAGSICVADALTVPLLPHLRSPGAAEPLACGADEVPQLAEVDAAVELLGRLAAVGAMGLIAELPKLGDLTRLLPGAAAEDIEDALSDLTRAALEAGADAVAVRGAGADVDRSVDAIAPLARFYRAPVLGIDGQRGWADGVQCQIGLLGPDGSWPELARGLVLTSGDVTEWWTPDDMRAVLRRRGEVG